MHVLRCGIRMMRIVCTIWDPINIGKQKSHTVLVVGGFCGLFTSLTCRHARSRLQRGGAVLFTDALRNLSGEVKSAHRTSMQTLDESVHLVLRGNNMISTRAQSL